MLACDFFGVDCAVTLQRFSVFFVLEVASRSVHLLGATMNPDNRWTTQQVRNLVMDLGDRVTQFRFLVRDRAGQFTASFDAVLTDMGIQVVRIPPRCSQENCFAERFVRTIRAELTDRMLIFGERCLRVVLAEYVRHCNGRRPHRARDLRSPQPSHPVVDLSRERIMRRPNSKWADQRVRTGSIKPLITIGGWLLEPHRLFSSDMPRGQRSRGRGARSIARLGVS